VNLSILDICPPRVYGRVTEPERAKLRRRNGGQAERIREWFEKSPGPITAHALAKALGMKRENGAACRLSELVAEGYLVKSAERVPGPLGVGLHLYSRRVS